MGAKQDSVEFIGKHFGMFNILSDLGIIKNSRYVIAKCDCGKVKQVRLADLKNGSSTNCGCVRSKKMTEISSKHSLSNHKLYRVWRGIIERCTYEKHVAYNYYGGRGITVCDEWLSDFMAFYNWAIENGWCEGLQVDRYPDKNGNYTPINCRIATSKMNNRNKANNRIIEYKGQSKCLSEWGEIFCLSHDVLKDRLNKLGWSIEKSFTTPLKVR